jgi:alkylation response protein AidB-like acyl-CoA dehydrogenase
MDVRLSPEQRALRDAAAQLVAAHAPTSVAQLDDTDRAAKLDAALAGAGWRELRAAADGGAPLASTVEAAIVAEELGRGGADTAFLGPTLAVELRRRAGLDSTAQETVLFRPDLAGPLVVEGPTASGVAVDAAGAEHALALTPTGELVAVALPVAAVQRDLTRPVATVVDAPVTPLGGQLSPDDLTGWHAVGLALTCADLVGTMRGALHLATGYAKIRHQYGVAIGSFQSVQHLLADAFVAAEGSTSIARHAAWAADHLPVDGALAAAAAAKAYCARAARSVAETAIQVHGGIGNTWECLAHVHLRRALLSSQLLGDAGVNLTRVLAHRGVYSGLR